MRSRDGPSNGLTLASANVGIEIRFWHIPTLRELAVVPTPNMGYALRRR